MNSEPKRLPPEAVLGGSLSALLRSSRTESFGPYFADRVMRRLSRVPEVSGADALYDSLRWIFVRTSAFGLAAAIILCLINVLAFQDLEVATSFIDTLFGLPSATVSDALSYGAL